MAVNTTPVGSPLKRVLEGDSYVLLGLTCIPLVGCIVSRIYGQGPLGVMAQKEKDVPRLIEIIKLKNDYKMAHIASWVATTALLVFSGFSLFWTGLGCFFIASTVADQIVKNKAVIAELETTGHRDGMSSEVC